MANLWHSLEILSTQAALLMEWKQEFGDDFAAARAFLRPTQQQAESYPCSQAFACGCRHRVIFDSPEDITAMCDCEEGGCDPIRLRPSDLIVYDLDGRMLAAAIRRAFHFGELESAGFEEVRSRLVGSWGVRRSRVFFNVPISEKGLLKEIERLCAAVPDPFIVLTPTSRFCTPMVERVLRLQGCAHMAADRDRHADGSWASGIGSCRQEHRGCRIRRFRKAGRARKALGIGHCTSRG
jgi:hypothetical protein